MQLGLWQGMALPTLALLSTCMLGTGINDSAEDRGGYMLLGRVWARAPGGRTRIPDTSLQPTYSQHIMEVLAISALLEDVLHAQENVPQVIVSWEFRLGDFPSCHILQTETHLGRGSQESQLGSPTI